MMTMELLFSLRKSARPFLLFLVSLNVVAQQATGAASPTPVHLKAFVNDTDTEKGQSVIAVSVGYAKPPNDAALVPHAIAIKGSVSDYEKPSLYRLMATSSKGEKEIVPIERVVVTGIENGTASAVNLVPKAILKADFKYDVQLLSPDMFQPASPNFVHGPEKDNLSVPAAELKAEVDYIHMRTLQNKAELKQGDHLGAGSFSYTYRFYQPASGTTPMRFIEASAKADVDFLSTANESYFNSVVAKLSLLQLGMFGKEDQYNLQGERVIEGSIIKGAYYVGFEGSFESDKDFSTIDGTVGLTWKTHVKNPLTTFLHNAILDLTSTRTDESGQRVLGRALDAGVAPLLSLNYDYVGHVKHSDNTNSGSQRLKGGFTWDWPLARKFNLPVFDSDFDADILITLEAIYDVDMEVVRDNSKIVLDLHQRRAKDDGFSFTLSYERGKATPTFKNVDTLLAGLKLSF